MIWLGRIVIALIVLVAGFAIIVYAVSSLRLNARYDIPDSALTLAVPIETASLARGKHLATILGCVDCHGKNLAGDVFLDVTPFRLVAPNLTRGAGGIGGSFSDADFVRAIRHGVAPDGRAFLMMPAKVFNHLNDADLADVIAYVKSVPAVDQKLPAEQIRPLGRMLMVFNKLPPPPAALIDHTAPHPVRETPSVTVDYGRYLANAVGCTDCHRADLTGGPIAGMPPNAPHAQNITPAGIGSWTETDFVRALRVGKRPDGTTISRLMPWPYTASMTDEELRALWLYVHSVPAKS